MKVDGTVMTGEDVWMYVLDPDAKTTNDLMWRKYYKPRFSAVGSLEEDHFQVFFTTFIFLSAMLDR